MLTSSVCLVVRCQEQTSQSSRAFSFRVHSRAFWKEYAFRLTLTNLIQKVKCDHLTSSSTTHTHKDHVSLKKGTSTCSSGPHRTTTSQATTLGESAATRALGHRDRCRQDLSSPARLQFEYGSNLARSAHHLLFSSSSCYHPPKSGHDQPRPLPSQSPRNLVYLMQCRMEHGKPCGR